MNVRESYSPALEQGTLPDPAPAKIGGMGPHTTYLSATPVGLLEVSGEFVALLLLRKATKYVSDLAPPRTGSGVGGMDGVFHLPSGWVGLSWMIPLYQCAHCIALVGEEDDGGLALPSSPLRLVGGWVASVWTLFVGGHQGRVRPERKRVLACS